MPLARIITDVADDCLELTMQLRARGYQVETVSPGAIPTTPADLEVRLEECAPEDMVAQAAQGASTGDLWVYVAPGALDGSAHPIRTIPLSSGLTEHLPALPKVLPVTARPVVSTPPVMGALAIDSHDEDPILAEVHTFPIPEIVTPPREPASAILVEIPDVVRQEATPEVKATTVQKHVQDEPALVGKMAAEASEQRPTPTSNLPSVKWLIDPDKPANTEPASFTIPVAPEPVRAKIPPPIQNVRRIATRKTNWDFQSLQIAGGLAALALLAWLLIGTGRPEATATSTGHSTVLQASKPAPVPQATSVPPVAEENSKKPSAGRIQNAPSAIAKTGAPSPQPQATNAVQKPAKARSHEDGLIAEDTVVFYEHKPGPPRAKAQSESSVKRYTDQN